MQATPEFTIKDLVKKSVSDYANFEGGNQIFIIFETHSPEMKKLSEGGEFIYKGTSYQLK